MLAWIPIHFPITGRSLAVALALLFPALLAACGGGGADPTDGGVAFLTGEATTADGLGDPVAGLTLHLVEAAESTTTAADGTFAFDLVPAGTLSLEVVAPETAWATALSLAPDWAGGGGNGAGEGAQHQRGHGFDAGDEDDGDTVDAGGVHVLQVRDRERVHLRLRLEDGVVREMECVRERLQEREREQFMEQTGAGGAGLYGTCEQERRQDRERFEVCVRGAPEGTDLEAVVVAPGGDEESQGTRTVSGGKACWACDTSTGGRLPFSCGSVGDLEGHEIQVRAFGTGAVLLRARLGAVPDEPGPGPFGAASGARAGSASLATQAQLQAGDLDRTRDQDRTNRPR